MSDAAADLRAMVASGTSPREINDIARAAHRARVEQEVADGKWKCPKCRAPMSLMAESVILFCASGCRI